jgi:WD40 repeat protein
MKVWRLICAGVLCFLSVLSGKISAVDEGPPQIQLVAYALHSNPNSADISPDEQSVVTEITRREETPDPGTKRFLEVAEIWNFKEDKLLAEFLLEQNDVKASAASYFPNPIRGERIIRFSPDGSRVIVLLNRTLHVLRGRDLGEVHTYQLVAPPKYEIRTMQISPSGDLVAVLWARNMVNGTIVIYDLMSGIRVNSWDIPQGWVSFTNNLAWNPDGSLLLVPVPNAMPCMSPGNAPDLFAFDVRTGATVQKFNTGLLTGTIAITSDGRVLAVDRNCLGVFKNHDPKLRVFDLSTGKIVQEISGRGAGVRYSVSISADGRRFLAFTGKMKAGFDWLDAVPYDVRVDSTFSVWNLHNYQGIVTSQNIPGLNALGLRLSPKGGYAISIGKASFIYELP